jgi:hypothetical protein
VLPAALSAKSAHYIVTNNCDEADYTPEYIYAVPVSN